MSSADYYKTGQQMQIRKGAARVRPPHMPQSASHSAGGQAHPTGRPLTASRSFTPVQLLAMMVAVVVVVEMKAVQAEAFGPRFIQEARCQDARQGEAEMPGCKQLFPSPSPPNRWYSIT